MAQCRQNYCQARVAEHHWVEQRADDHQSLGWLIEPDAIEWAAEHHWVGQRADHQSLSWLIERDAIE